MSFHQVSGSDDRQRCGTFSTLAEAMASGMLKAATGSDSPAFIVEGEGLSGGRLVAGYDREFGWVELDVDEETPAWWGKLSAQTRSELLGNPRARLTPALRDAVLRAGGPLIAVHWVENGPANAELDFAMTTRDWLMRRSLIERF